MFSFNNVRVRACVYGKGAKLAFTPSPPMRIKSGKGFAGFGLPSPTPF
jgi:hypothetical protein